MKIRLLLLISFISLTFFDSVAQTYCFSRATSTFNQNRINNFTFNTINQTSPANTCELYTDNTVISTNVTQGATYTASVTGGTCSAFGSVPGWSLAIFVDWNNDFDFDDPGEDVLRAGPATSLTGTLTGSITIPTNLAPGNRRMRVIHNASTAAASINPCGTYFNGETEDYTINVQPTATFDVGITRVRAGGMFTQVPLSQASFDFEGDLFNPGASTVTNATLNVNVTPGGFTSSGSAGTLLQLDNKTANITNSFVASQTGTYTASFDVTISENDGFSGNDRADVSFEVTDTVMARDNNAFDGNIGGTQSIEFGQTIEVINPDTLTTVSIRLGSPTIGSRCKIYVRAWDANNNRPGAIVDSSRTLQISSSNARWYNFKIGCGERILPPGKYFIGVYQINPVNMSLSYANYRLDDETFLYVNLLDGNGWRASNDPGLNTLVDEITLMIRSNFGTYRETNVINGGDVFEYCQGVPGVLKTGDFESYQWSDGSFLDSLVVTNPGIYSVTVTDELGCVYEDQINAQQAAPIQFTQSVTNASDCGRLDGSATVTAQGANGPYTYEWENGTQGNSISNVGGGTYDVTITGANGCQTIGKIGIGGLNPVLNLSSQTPSCNGFSDGQVFLDIAEGAAPYTYSWSNGSSDSALSNIAAGPYTVTVTGAGGCSTTQTIIVQNPPQIFINGGNSVEPSVCGANDAEAVATVSGGIAPYTYLWEDGTTTPVRVGLLAGTYSVSVTDDLGCTKAETIVISDPNAPSLQATGSTLSCGDDENGTASVTVNGGTGTVNVLWSNGETGNSISDLGIGTYVAQAVDGAGCVAFAEVEIDGPAPIEINLGVNYSSICNDEVFIQSISGGTRPYSYQWNDDNQSTSSAVAGVCNGSYKLVVTDNNGCKDSAVAVVFNPTTEVSEAALSETVKVYPNPAAEEIFIESDDQIIEFIQLFDLSGSLVSRVENQSGLNRQVVSLADVNSGLYLLQIQFDTGDIRTNRISVVK